MRDNMGTKLDNMDNKSSLPQNQSLSSDWQSALRSVHSEQPQISNNPFSTGQGGLNTMRRNGGAC